MQPASQTAGRQQLGWLGAAGPAARLGVACTGTGVAHLEVHDLLDLGGVPLADRRGADDLHRQWGLLVSPPCEGLSGAGHGHQSTQHLSSGLPSIAACLGSRLQRASRCRLTGRANAGTAASEAAAAAAAAACKHAGRTHAWAGKVFEDINPRHQGRTLTEGLLPAHHRVPGAGRARLRFIIFSAMFLIGFFLVFFPHLFPHYFLHCRF